MKIENIALKSVINYLPLLAHNSTNFGWLKFQIHDNNNFQIIATKKN